MEKGNTKAQILAASLELFSEQGFEATSISQIADAVGVRKASLYAHFSSKQDILNSLMGELTEEFNQHLIFVNADWDNPEFTKDKEHMDAEAVGAMIKGQIRYIIHDPRISKVRKMLTIEQFQNPELKKVHSYQSYEVILSYNTGLMKFLIRQGILIDEDPQIMAAQFAWPISMWTALCDREPQREAEAMALMDQHIRQFFRVYGK